MKLIFHFLSFALGASFIAKIKARENLRENVEIEVKDDVYFQLKVAADKLLMLLKGAPDLDAGFGGSDASDLNTLRSLTCSAPGGRCNRDRDCCEGTHPFCGGGRGDAVLGRKLCVNCLTDTHCPGSVSCENAGTPQAACDMASINTFPGMALMRQGYDIYKSDPLRLNGVRDNGRSTRTVLKLDYFNGKLKGNRDVPAGIEVIDETPNCSVELSSSTMETYDRFKEETGRGVTIGVDATVPTEGGPLNLGTSVGASSRRVWEESARSGKMTSTSRAQCKIYTFSVDHAPDFDDDFLGYLSSFDGQTNSYVGLFSRYGTHIVTTAVMGTSFGATIEMTESEASTLGTSASSIQHTLNLGMPGIFNLSTSDDSDESKEAENSIRQSGADITIWTVGGGVSLDVESWREQALKSPDILEIKSLMSLCRLLSDKGIPNFDEKTCGSAYEPYCETILGDDRICKGQNSEVDCVHTSQCRNQICERGRCIDHWNPLYKQEGVSHTTHRFSEENGGYSQEATGPISKINCYNNRCDDKSFTYYTFGASDAFQHPSHPTSWFSEEDSTKFCPEDMLVNRMQCSGDNCDNIKLYCAQLKPEFRIIKERTWSSDWFWEGEHRECLDGYYLRGLKCHGNDCGGLELFCVAVETNQPSFSL